MQTGKNEKLQMLLELDRQVEVAWRAAKLKDDDRKHAAAMVVSAWENKMRTYAHVRADGRHAQVHVYPRKWSSCLKQHHPIRLTRWSPYHRDKLT